MDGSKESSIGDNLPDYPILGKTRASGNKRESRVAKHHKRNPSVFPGMEIYEQRQVQKASHSEDPPT